MTAFALRSSVLLPLWTYVRSSSSATASTNASWPSSEMTDMSRGASVPITLMVGNPPFEPGMYRTRQSFDRGARLQPSGDDTLMRPSSTVIVVSGSIAGRSSDASASPAARLPRGAFVPPLHPDSTLPSTSAITTTPIVRMGTSRMSLSLGPLPPGTPPDGRTPFRGDGAAGLRPRRSPP